MKRLVSLILTVIMIMSVLPCCFANASISNNNVTFGARWAITTDGSLYAWGDNWNGELGINSDVTYETTEPTKVMDNIVSADMSSYHAVALSNDGSLYTWGDVEWGMHKVNRGHYRPYKIMDNVTFALAGGSYSMLNSHMQHAIAGLRIEYSNKFLQTLFDIWDEVVDKGFSAAMKIATGNAYGLGKVAWGTIFNATGVTKKGEALKSFYSLYCYNGALDKEFSDVILSSKDNVDIAYVNALINLQKATKTVAINSISDMANWWAKDEVNQSADELKNSLNSWSYYTWWNTNTANNGGNNGGGGGSW